MLVIDPDPCIDCSLCAPECPVDAIVGPISENNELTTDERYWLDLNAGITAAPLFYSAHAHTPGPQLLSSRFNNVPDCAALMGSDRRHH